MRKIMAFMINQDRVHLRQLCEGDDFDIKFFDIFQISLANLFELGGGVNLLFVSDDIDFLQLAFRLYNQRFENFVYISAEKNSSKSFEEFDIFLTSPITEDEHVSKPIYVLGEVPKTNIGINFKMIKSFEEIETIEKNEKSIQKVFHFKNRFLISEFIDFDYKIITLDNSLSKGTLSLDDFFFNLEDELTQNIEYIFRVFDDLSKDITPYINQIKTVLDELSQKEQEKFIIHIKFLINNLNDENIKNYLFSFLANLKFFTTKMFDSLINEIINNTKLTKENKYFLFWQYTRINFTKPLEKQVSQEVFWTFYKNIYTEYKKVFKNIEFIPKEKRNKDLIFLFASQMLGELHAPTKNFLDVAYSLIKDFNKEVLIINTAEVLTNIGEIPFYNRIVANKVTQYANTNQIPYKDINIPFYQCIDDMPNDNEILNILLIVQEYKPYFILSLSTILTADLASNLITTATFPTASNLTISQSQIHIKGGELRENQKELLKFLNINEKSIITIYRDKQEIKASQSTYSKKSFNLPEDKFLLSVVGNRLNDEISDKFISMILDTISENTYIVFIGFFSDYENYCSKFSALKENSSYLGFQENLYDILKLFDLFVNPPRNGGGTSGLWALMNSLPIVTLNYGDIYSITKSNFGVKTLEEMKDVIIKYSRDSTYHKEQSKLAYEIYDSSNTMEENLALILNELETNTYFK